MKYYLIDDMTLIVISNVIIPKEDFHNYYNALRLSPHKFPVMPDLEAELSSKGYKDCDEVPVSEFKFVAMPVQQAIEMTEC